MKEFCTKCEDQYADPEYSQGEINLCTQCAMDWGKCYLEGNEE